MKVFQLKGKELKKIGRQMSKAVDSRHFHIKNIPGR